MTVEWGLSGKKVEVSALDKINTHRILQRLTKHMIGVIDGLSKRTGRHIGYRLKRRVERDAMFRLVNAKTTLNIKTASVQRRRPNTLTVIMESSIGPITFKGRDQLR